MVLQSEGARWSLAQRFVDDAVQSPSVSAAPSPTNSDSWSAGNGDHTEALAAFGAYLTEAGTRLRFAPHACRAGGIGFKTTRASRSPRAPWSRHRMNLCWSRSASKTLATKQWTGERGLHEFSTKTPGSKNRVRCQRVRAQPKRGCGQCLNVMAGQPWATTRESFSIGCFAWSRWKTSWGEGSAGTAYVAGQKARPFARAKKARRLLELCKNAQSGHYRSTAAQ